MVAQTGIRSPQKTFVDGDVGLFAMNGGREGTNTLWVDGITAEAGDAGQIPGTPQVDPVQEVGPPGDTCDAPCRLGVCSPTNRSTDLRLGRKERI